jgi:catechol 2,3-dioxygenase-like lactoylglutathione lyase family enzyme
MHIRSLDLYTPDLEHTRQYYTGVLGLPLDGPTDPGAINLRAGQTRLNFRQAEPAWAGRYHFAFDVPASRFAAAVAWLIQRQAPLANREGKTRFHSDSWNSDSVYFTDPQGNILELIARHSKPAALSTPATAPFSSAEILCISEIGLCTEDVRSSAADLLNQIPGLAIYDGADSDVFTALGDPDGLLILVRLGRIWMPDSGVPAEYQPLNLFLETGAGQHHSLSAPPYPFQLA